MRSASRNQALALPTLALSPSIQAALALLLPPEDDGPTDGPPTGGRAIVLSQLRSIGLSDAELHWLVELLLVEPSKRLPGPGTTGRRHGALPLETAYRLTRAGLCWAREILADRRPTASSSRIGAGTPFWDADNRTLWWGDQIVLQFLRRHGPNLEALLAAFQKQSWKPCIADPLAQKKASKSNPRLHDAIKYLNKRLERTPLRFRGSGDGKGVRWESVTARGARSSPDFP